MLKRLCQCIGLSSLMLVMNYGDMLGGGADVRMHVPYSLRGICAAHIADILLLGLALFLLLTATSGTRASRGVRLVMAMVVPPYVVERMRLLLPIHVSDGGLLLGSAVWVGVLLVLVLRFPAAYRRVMRLGDAAGVVLAVFSAFSIAQLLQMTLWKPGPQEIRAGWERGPQEERTHPRLVWILFDELSYKQVFESRAHDLALPNFDALRSESTVYTEMQPIGMRTVKVVPSLLSGAVVEDLRFGFDNRLRVRYDGTHGWRGLDGNGTVFADARRAGWRTGAVGWYNPYCTLYGGALDSCYWSNLDRLEGNMAQRASFVRNTWRPLAEAATELVSPAAADRERCNFDVRQRYETYRDLDAHAKRMMAEDQADFMFLHLSTPHSPNIWSRAKDGFVQRCGSSYLDNLALADRELGQMMAVLKRSPRWKDTTVIVEGDHSWRVMLWEGRPSWTDEDEQASHGEFDPRPLVLIHAADQREARTDARAMPLEYVHGAIEDVLQGKAARP